MKFTCATIVFVLALTVSGTAAKAILIDFEAFTVGDGLPQVNAVTTPLGATFDASSDGQVNGGPFQVFDLGGNNVIRSGTFPGDADVLINFSAPVAFVQVTFVENPDAVADHLIRIVARDRTGTPETIAGDPLANVVGGDNGFEPDILSISANGILSLQLESGSGRIYFDTVQFRFASRGSVPEPGTLALFGLALAGMGLLRRRRPGAA